MSELGRIFSSKMIALRNGRSYRQFAKDIYEATGESLSHSILHEYENPEGKEPKRETIDILAKYADVSPSWFYEEDKNYSDDNAGAALGDQIKLAREERGLSQEIVAKEVQQNYPGVHLSVPYLDMIENNIQVNLSVKLLNALLDYFGLSQANSTIHKDTVSMDIRKISRAAENMTPEKRQQWMEIAMNIAKAIAPEAFDDDKDSKK